MSAQDEANVEREELARLLAEIGKADAFDSLNDFGKELWRKDADKVILAGYRRSRATDALSVLTPPALAKLLYAEIWSEVEQHDVVDPYVEEAARILEIIRGYRREAPGEAKMGDGTEVAASRSSGSAAQFDLALLNDAVGRATFTLDQMVSMLESATGMVRVAVRWTEDNGPADFTVRQALYALAGYAVRAADNFYPEKCAKSKVSP